MPRHEGVDRSFYEELGRLVAGSVNLNTEEIRGSLSNNDQNRITLQSTWVDPSSNERRAWSVSYYTYIGESTRQEALNRLANTLVSDVICDQQSESIHERLNTYLSFNDEDFRRHMDIVLSRNPHLMLYYEEETSNEEPMKIGDWSDDNE